MMLKQNELELLARVEGLRLIFHKVSNYQGHVTRKKLLVSEAHY